MMTIKSMAENREAAGYTGEPSNLSNIHALQSWQLLRHLMINGVPSQDKASLHHPKSLVKAYLKTKKDIFCYYI